MTNEELTELRATLIQLANALETERACVKRIIAVIERRITPAAEAMKQTVQNATVASAARYNSPV